MKAFGFHFRRLPLWKQNGSCAMRGFSQGRVTRCGRASVVEFVGEYQAPRGATKRDRITYCETHGSAVARLYNARIEAGDDAA